MEAGSDPGTALARGWLERSPFVVEVTAEDGTAVATALVTYRL